MATTTAGAASGRFGPELPGLNGRTARRPPAVGDGLPAQAPKPPRRADAPLTKLGRLVIAGVHAAVLIGLLVFITSQFARAWTAPKRQAVVTVVTPSAREVPSPADGVFHADGPLYKGTPVREGEPLGTVESPVLATRVQALDEQLEVLMHRRLLLGGRKESADQAKLELREVCQRIVAIQGELAVLKATQQQMRITSPVSGRIAHSLSGSQSVRQHETVATVWTEADDLVVEVRAPVALIRRLIRKGRFPVTFHSDHDQYQVVVAPMPDTLTPDDSRVNDGVDERWAVVQCRPDDLPQAVAFPGAIGRL